MGCVYRAYDPRLERFVALKVISEATASAAANARLVREARAAAEFDHPNAVAIFDVGELDGAPHIVMELVEGRTLRRADGDALPPVAIVGVEVAGGDLASRSLGRSFASSTSHAQTIRGAARIDGAQSSEVLIRACAFATC